MENFFFGIFLVLFNPCLNCFFRNSQVLCEVGIVVNIVNPSSLKKLYFNGYFFLSVNDLLVRT